MNFIYALLKNNGKTTFSERVFYIGQTTDIKTRMNSHKSNSERNRIKNYIVKKYGFEYIILYTFESKIETDEMESFLIRFIGRICKNDGPLANISDGTNADKPKYTEQDVKYHLDKLRELRVSVREYCKVSGMSKKTMLRWCRLNNFKIKNTNELNSEKILELYNTNKNIQEISIILKMSQETIKKYLRDNNIIIRLEIIRKNKEVDIIKLFNNGLNIKEIANELNLCDASVRKYLKNNNLIILRKTNSIEQIDFYLNDWSNSNKSVIQYCNENNLKPDTFNQWKFNKIGKISEMDKKIRDLKDKTIINMYNFGFSYEEIAEAIPYNKDTIKKKIYKYKQQSEQLNEQ